MLSYIVIGGRKCGSTSLQKYLQNYGHDCIRVEQLFTRHDGPKIYLEKYSNRVPVVIIRNPADRVWSDYWHSKRMGRNVMNYEEYCKFEQYDSEFFGDLNPISQSNYRKWFKNWKDIDLQARWLEDLTQLSSFPHLTKGDYPKMPDKLRSLTLEWIIDDTIGAC